EAEVPAAGRVARHALATRAGVGRDDGDAQLGGDALGAGLLHEVLVGAGEAGQPVQYRYGSGFGLRRQVDREDHVAAERPGAVADALVPAAEALVGGDGFDRSAHRRQKWITERMLLPSCIRSRARLMSSSPIVWVMKVS